MPAPQRCAVPRDNPRMNKAGWRWALGVLTLLGSVATAQTPNSKSAEGQAYGARDDVMRLADDIVARHHELDARWLREQLQRARFVGVVQKLIMPPPAAEGKTTVKNWSAYRARFVERDRIAAGVAFWRANEPWLLRAEERWGVPAQVIVGVIGVETYYGRLTGNFRVIDALATLAFDFPAGRRDRGPFFRSELEQFLLWCSRERCDPAQVQGSFAGAMGLPQFMPSSLNTWAVDFDGDGRIDLAGSAADAIGSVAHYLNYFGWERGLPTHFDVRAPDNDGDRALLLGPDILPLFSAEEFTERGATLTAEGRAHEGPLALVELHNGEAAAPSHVAGTRNFWTVTRYNWSSYYALAVIDLGAAVAERVRNRGQGANELTKAR
jgi:membrane-bound lytic murein transglycosylase B